jgi:hypothetical protein
VRSWGVRARALAFGIGKRLGVSEGEPAQATFTLEINEWNGVSEPRLVLRTARAAEIRVQRASREEDPQEGELVLFAAP